MTDWYTVGLFAGLGVAVGIAVVGVLGGRRIAVIAPLLGAVLGVALGLAFEDVEEAVAGGVGGVLGAFGSAQLVTGALRRGGTRLATGLFVVYGVIVTIAGINPSDATLDKAEGVNINLWTGLGMLLLGIFFLVWLKLRPTPPPPPPTAESEEKPGE